MGHLLDALSRAYDVLGFDAAAGGDEVFRDLVLARIIEPASKLDSLRVLEEAGVARGVVPDRASGACRPMRRRRGGSELSAACAAHARLGPASLVLYDVSTLYFETDQGDGFREPGFSKERRLEPQITIGLLTGAGRVPADGLRVRGQQGRDQDDAAGHRGVHGRPPAARRHRRRGRRDDLRGEPEGDRGRRAVVHPRHEDPRRPLRRRASGGASTPARRSPTGTSSPSPGPPGRTASAATRSIYYQYKADRARRTLRGIDEQVAKAAKAVAGLAPVKRNRFIPLDGAAKSVNRDLEAKARALAGLKGYVTNLAACPDGTPVTAEFVIGAYHRLFEIEKSFRMSKQRPAGPAGLPPPARLHRGPPDHRVRRPGRQPLDRAPDRLVHQQIRQDRPPLPHHRDPGRTARPSPPPTRSPTTSGQPSTKSTADQLRTKLYDNPRYGQIRGCRGLPHSLTPFTGRPVRWPLLGRPGPVYPRTPGETPVARGAGRLPGVPYGGQPPVGPDPADAGALPYPRSRFTSPGIKATPLTLLLDRIVRDDESGAGATLRIFRRFRPRGCMVVSVRESWLNGSPQVQDVLIASAGGG